MRLAGQVADAQQAVLDLCKRAENGAHGIRRDAGLAREIGEVGPRNIRNQQQVGLQADCLLGIAERRYAVLPDQADDVAVLRAVGVDAHCGYAFGGNDGKQQVVGRQRLRGDAGRGLGEREGKAVKVSEGSRKPGAGGRRSALSVRRAAEAENAAAVSHPEDERRGGRREQPAAGRSSRRPRVRARPFVD